MVVAEKTQIPLSKEPAAGSIDKSKLPTRDSRDTLWAFIRRFNARIASLETEVSTLRRDINATRRKVYREEEKQPPTAITEVSKGPAGSGNGGGLDFLFS